MSADFVVWKAPVVSGPDEADQLLVRFYEGHEVEAFERSEDLLRFHDELMEAFPPLESFPDDQILTDSPWAMTPERSDRVITLNVVWSTPPDQLATIYTLAMRYGLVLYDPQAPKVHPPVRPRAAVEGGVLGGTVAVVYGLLMVFAGLLVLNLPFPGLLLSAVGVAAMLIGLGVVRASREKGKARGGREDSVEPR